jgi:hypothetical protein
VQLEHLSWSQINSIDKCGYQYHLYRNLGITLPPGFAQTRGKVIHKPIEKNMLHKLEHGALLTVEEVMQIASDEIDAAYKGPMTLDGDYAEMTLEQARSQTKDEVVGLAKLHATELAPIITPRAVEKKVTLAASEALPVKLVGILDLVTDKGIRDTKTKTKAPPAMLAHQSGQLSCYTLLHLAEYKTHPTEIGLDVLWRTPGKGVCKHDTLWTTREVKDLEVFIARANAALRAIEAEIFLPAPEDSWACTKKFCGYTEQCPYFAGRPRPTS